MNKWIIFDMDSTLIDTEPLYFSAINEFANLIATRFGFDIDDVKNVQTEIDAGLYHKYGYATDRFAMSFEMTAKHFLGSGCADHLIQQVRQIAMAVFNTRSKEFSYSNETVRRFVNAGYKIAVITAGERWVQVKRFDDLTMRNLFHDCWVVLKKTREVFQDFCTKHNVDINHSWMIGDSLSSDIIPAVEAGLNAVHLQTSNWVTRDRHSSLPKGAFSVKDLSYVPCIILETRNA